MFFGRYLLLLCSLSVASVPTASYPPDFSVCAHSVSGVSGADVCVAPGAPATRLSLIGGARGAPLPFPPFSLTISATPDSLVHANITTRRSGVALLLTSVGSAPMFALSLLSPGNSVPCVDVGGCFDSFTLVGSPSAVGEWLGKLAAVDTSTPTPEMRVTLSGIAVGVRIELWTSEIIPSDRLVFDVSFVNSNADADADASSYAKSALPFKLRAPTQVVIGRGGDPICLSIGASVVAGGAASALARITITLSTDVLGVGENDLPQDAGASLSMSTPCEGGFLCSVGAGVGGALAARISSMASRALSLEGEPDALARLLSASNKAGDGRCIAISARDAEASGRVRVLVTAAALGVGGAEQSIDFLVFFAPNVVEDKRTLSLTAQAQVAAPTPPPSVATVLRTALYSSVLSALTPPDVSTALLVLGEPTVPTMSGTSGTGGLARLPALHASTALSALAASETGAFFFSIDCSDPRACAGAVVSDAAPRLKVFPCANGDVQVWGGGGSFGGTKKPFFVPSHADGRSRSGVGARHRAAPSSPPPRRRRRCVARREF